MEPIKQELIAVEEGEQAPLDLSNIDAELKKYKKSGSVINADSWRRLRQNKAAMAGLFLVGIYLIMLIFADLIVPYTVATEQNLAQRLLMPSAQHWFGTDAFGRDVFARIVHATRNSFLLAVISVTVGMCIGGTVAAVAGYYGGKVDAVIVRIMDTILCIPFILLALALVAVLGSGLQNLLLAMIISTIPTYVRVVRSSILTIVDQDFIEASRACGARGFFIILKHVLPNAIGPIIVQSTLSIGTIIIMSATLSYVGMGIQPPAPEWGYMLAESKSYMQHYPHLVLCPGLAIVFCCLSLNLVGDGLRDALDPRLKD